MYRPKNTWKAPLRIVFSLFCRIFVMGRRRVDKIIQYHLENIPSTAPIFLAVRSGDTIWDNEIYNYPELISPSTVA